MIPFFVQSGARGGDGADPRLTAFIVAALLMTGWCSAVDRLQVPFAYSKFSQQFTRSDKIVIMAYL